MTDIPEHLVASMNRVRHKSATARLLIQEAKIRGWAVRETYDERLFFLTDKNAVEHPVFGMNTTLNSYAGTVIATLKDLSLAALQGYVGPIIPETMLYSTPEAAKEFLGKYDKLVVKPAGGAHGKAVTTGITNEASLMRAIERAQVDFPTILLQQHVEGSEHRLLVVGDTCVAVIERKPAYVTGDGEHTVSELIFQKNSQPVRDNGRGTLSKIKVEEVAQYLTDEQLSFVPTVDEQVQVAGVSNLSRGGTAIDVTDEIGPETKKLAVAIAKRAGLMVAGIDFLISDRARDAEPGNLYFLELNSQPGIRMHHYPSVGKKRNVATAILDLLEQVGRP